MEYSSELYERETIKRMVKHYVKLLESIVEDAERPVFALPMLSEAEIQQLLSLRTDPRQRLLSLSASMNYSRSRCDARQML